MCLALRARAASCPGISPETAQRLFDRVKQVPVGEGYHFDGVGTNKSELVVQWSLNGAPCPPIRVKVGNCESRLGLAELDLHVPPELSASCPGLQAVVLELSEAVAAERPVGQGLSLPPWAVGALAALIFVICLAG